jgi:hypothetical protein
MRKLTVTLCLSVALTGNVSAQDISQISAATGRSNAVPVLALPENRPPKISTKGLCPATFVGDQRPVSWKMLVPNILCDQKPSGFFHGMLYKGIAFFRLRPLSERLPDWFCLIRAQHLTSGAILHFTVSIRC